MCHRRTIAALFSLGLILAGCESPAQPAATNPPGHGPADGRNLAPELQRDVGSDPLWPNDLNRGGGGGVR